jgi:hypothetical protein
MIAAAGSEFEMAPEMARSPPSTGTASPSETRS